MRLRFAPAWCAAPALTLTTLAQAAIPIETLPLSSPSTPVTPSPSATATPAAPEQPSMLWNLYQQVQRLEQEVRSLRGQVETHDQQLDQLGNDLKNRFTDLDQRLTALASNSPAATPAEAPAGTTVPPVPASATAAAAPAAVPVDPEADKRAYLAAYEAYKAGGAAQAIEPMRQFIQQFPQSSYIANANYWLGEFYLANDPPSFAKARQQFERVMQDYPKTAKAPAALYRLATLSDVEGKRTEALRHMNRLVSDYADSKEAGFARTYLKTRPDSAAPAGKTPAAPTTPAAGKSTAKPAAASPKTSTKSAPAPSKPREAI